MKVSITELTNDARHLAGATRGREDLAKLASKVTENDSTLLLDFAGVESVTSSYLKALLFPFFDTVTVERAAPELRGAFPVVTRLQDLVREELMQLVALTSRQVVEALKHRGDEILIASIHGPLDPALAETIALLLRLGPTTATSLHAEAGGKIAVTAWNNRLADLYARRLAKRHRVGKQWIYEPIAREISNG